MSPVLSHLAFLAALGSLAAGGRILVQRPRSALHRGLAALGALQGAWGLALAVRWAGEPAAEGWAAAFLGAAALGWSLLAVFRRPRARGWVGALPPAAAALAGASLAFPGGPWTAGLLAVQALAQGAAVRGAWAPGRPAPTFLERSAVAGSAALGFAAAILAASFPGSPAYQLALAGLLVPPLLVRPGILTGPARTEARLAHAAWEACPEGLALFAPDGTFLRANAVWGRRSGTDPLVPGGGGPGLVGRVAPDGTCLLVRYEPIFDRFGDPVGWAASAQDLPAFHQACARYRLSPREREVSFLVLQGLSNRQILDQTGLSEGTVKTLLARAFAKTGSSTRQEHTRRLVFGGP